MMNIKKVSERSTKQEILAAYEELSHARRSESKIGPPSEEQKTDVRSEKEDALMDSVEKAQHGLIDATATCSAAMRKALEELSNEREAHEKRMTAQNEAWRREQEAYTYDRDLERRKEEAEYERKKEDEERSWALEKARREQVLVEKEAVIKMREAETKELERQARDFPAQLEKATQEIAVKVRAEVEATARVKADMQEKDSEREREIAKLKIQSLEETIKRHGAQISSLQTQLTQAQERSQSLAVTVIEGEARKRTGIPQEKSDIAGKQ